nr:unnamed protein product [Callosobruchus analis]
MIKINNMLYDCTKVTMGVPQGSVLGPLLFNVFPNDLILFLQINNNSHVTCYADDTTIVIIGDDLLELKQQAENIYHRVTYWSSNNSLKINHNKTELILLKQYIPPSIEYNNSEIKGTHKVKLLGVTFDEHLRWSDHIDNLCLKLHSSCYGLKFMKTQCSESILLTLYYANFHSHARYGILLWGTSQHAHRVFLFQKFAIRIIAGISSRTSCRLYFKKYKILTIYSIYILESCTYASKNREKTSNNGATHHHNTRNKDTLQPDQHKTTLYQKGFYFNSCKLYNSLSDDLQAPCNIWVFKRKLKSLLLEKNCYSIGVLTSIYFSLSSILLHSCMFLSSLYL